MSHTNFSMLIAMRLIMVKLLHTLMLNSVNIGVSAPFCTKVKSKESAIKDPLPDWNHTPSLDTFIFLISEDS